ncbi:MAG: hypothetical protein WBL28_03425 [Methylotenera sp.]
MTIKLIATLIRLGLMLMVAGFIPAAFAEDALKHDPFARPLLTATLPANPESADTNAEAEAPWEPTLTAVMVAGKHSLVNIDGVIIKLGEEKDGYRLIQVKDHEAVFKKGNKRIVLDMEMSDLQKNKERGGE